MLPSVKEREAQIRAYAASIGIDPDIAVQVARSEGLQANTWQSNLQQPYGREASYGDFQLHTDPTGKRPGLGNAFKEKTGLDPADPKNWEAMNRYALDQARIQGWGPWMGAKAAGITGKTGIGGQPSRPYQPALPSQAGASAGGTSMGGYAEGPGAVADRMASDGGLLGEDPVTAEGFDFAAMGDIGKLMKKYADSQATDDPGPQVIPAQVLQPLRRIQLGKGLLG